MKKITFFIFCLFLGVGMAVAQTRTVTGTVISDDDGEPIIGASIVVKGRATTGTITDYDGNFSLNVPDDAKTLVVSYIGMVTLEVAVSSNIRVTLKSDTQHLSEVVVTAMGITKERKSLGYAVQDVKADLLTQGASSTLSGALQGKVSGLEISPSSGMPGASAKMTIRGSRSFTGDNTPLYVIDGMPIASSSDRNTDNSVTGEDFTNRAMDIDPNDIESVNILKGQAAAALYGIRASNGVVIITTKSGRGARKDRPQISYSTSVSFDKVARYPEVQKNYAQGSNGAFNPSSSSSWGPKISDLPDDPTYGGNNFGFEGKYYVPQLAAALGVTKEDPDAWVTPQAYDSMRDFFNTGYTWNNSLNIQQANDKGFYSFSLGNTTQEGIVPSTGMNRYNAKLSAETKLHTNWTTGFSGNFTHSKVDKMTGANDGLTATVYLIPPSYDMEGIPYHEYGNPYSGTNYRTGFGNPYWQTNHNKFQEKTQRFFGNAYVDYKTKFDTQNHTLLVKYMLGTDAYQNNLTSLRGYGHEGTTGSIVYRGYTKTTFNSLLTAAYTWNINEDLVLDGLLGNEYRDDYKKYYSQTGTGFNFSGWNHMDNVGIYTSSEEYTKTRNVGFFGNLSLAWKNMLYLSATGRNDYVSTMPPGNHSFFYPSVSLGFIFTELEPLKNNILTYGKLRLSYAEVGMAGENYYPAYYSKGTYSGGFLSGITIAYPIAGQIGYHKSSTVYDPNLKPQNTVSYEIGPDLTFFNGLFSLNYTYSYQNVKDQIFPVPLPRSTGVTYYYTNAGRMQTIGHEITLSANPIRNRNINWDFAFNFSKIKSEVKELAEGVENLMMGGFTSPNVRAQIGETYPVVWGTTFARDDKGNLVLNDNNMPYAEGSGVIARVAPDFMLGFNTSLDIFKFRIGATFEWKQGGEMYAATKSIMDQMGVSKESGIERDNGYKTTVTGVKITGRDSNGDPIYGPVETHTIEGVKALQDYYTAKYSANEGLCYGNSFLKLREISIGYPVYQKNDLEVYLSAFARNITIWSELDGFDPETSQGNNNMSGAFERYSLPQASSYGFGVSVKF